MSVDKSTYPDFAPANMHKRMEKLMASAERDPAPALELLKQYPGLARNDDEWARRFAGIRPMLSQAQHCNSPDLFNALLAACPTPAARDAVTGRNVLESIMETGTMWPNTLAMIDALLAHPAYAQMDACAVNNAPSALLMAGQIIKLDSPKISERCFRLFTTMLDRTDPAQLKRHARLPTIAHWGYNEEASIRIARELADRGVDLNGRYGEEKHPLYMAADHDAHDAAAALLAAGINEAAIAGYARDIPGEFASHESVGDVIDTLGYEKRWHLRFRAKAMLEEQLARVETGECSAAELLLTKRGEPSWQARGLISRGMINQVFSRETAGIFASHEEQAATAVKLHAALEAPLRPSIDATFYNRECPPARPSDSAVVEYVRGRVAEVEHRGKA